MDETEKLRILLPHWIEHNNGHEAEWIKWAEVARNEGKESIAETINAAIQKMQEVNVILEKALSESGGPATENHDHHHH